VLEFARRKLADERWRRDCGHRANRFASFAVAVARPLCVGSSHIRPNRRVNIFR
jgi:hypothetical protein